MSTGNFEKVDTNLKAYRLVHDPVILLNLIYSKYGDIEEDLDLLYINQLVYDKSSRYNIFFKEYQYLNNDEEFLKRYYKKYESKPRIPKLSEYYKNYHLFFCRPNFKDLIISDLMENYGDDKAEVFYKNNYENTNSKNEQTDKHNSESLSSLDNITDNKIIFTKKAKKIIDNNLDNNYGTLTLTSTSIKSNINNKNENNINDGNNNNNNDGLISARSLNNSFEKMVHNLVCYKKNKKFDKNKKNEIKPNKNNIQSGKKLSNKVGGTYANKKINKNIIYSLNINTNPNNINNTNDKHLRNIHNKKSSLFSLLKSKNIINYMKTENNINKSINDKQSHIPVSINMNKSNNKVNKTNNSKKKFSSPKNIKDHNFHLTSKLEDFHNNILRPNTSFHHKRNKTVYFTSNQIGGITNPSNTLNNNYINTLTNILKNNNNSRNYIDNFKNSNNKQTKFNNYLTINNSNNLINKQRGFNEMKNRLKNKTFEVDNLIGLKDNLKVYHKNKINHNNVEINNQIIIKKNNIPGVSGSKFSLMKNPLKSYNNKININKNVKNNIKYFNPKFSPINCFNKNIINNNKNVGLHKKSQTTILSNILETSPKNQIFSPISLVKYQNKIYNINKSESISSKIKPKIGNHKINNLNINFNNVIFNAPLSNLNQNINFNNNFINNTNENLSYKLLTPTNNHNNFNNTYINKTNNNSNITNVKEPHEKINYITNLKNFCNFSRNKINIYTGSLSQNDDNYSLIKNNNTNKNTNTNNKQIIYDKNKITNQTYSNYSNLYSNEKEEIFKKKKTEIIIPKPINKKIVLKNSGVKTSSQIKKTKKKIEGRNKKFEGERGFGKTENFKKNINEKINECFKTKEDKNNMNNSNHLYSSPNTTGRIFTIQPINVNRNTNLMSKKMVKTKQKIKLK